MNTSYNKDEFRRFFESECTWLSGFMRNVRRYSRRRALFCPVTERVWTYGTLNAEANRLANALAKDGVGKGDVVMYQLLNCPEFVFTYIAAQKLGAVGSPMNFRLSSGEGALTIDDSEPKAMIYEAELESTVAEALAMAKNPPAVLIRVGGEAGTSPAIAGAVNYADYVANACEDDPPMPDVDMYDETTRLYTSGTTGRPKGVPISSINEVMSSHDVIMSFPLNANDKTMNMTPWFHRGGLHSGGPTPTLYAGGEVVIMRKFNARTCLEYVEKYGITFLIGVPAVLAQLTKEQEAMDMDLSSLHGIITMGSPLERAAAKRFMQVLTPNIFNGYGTTETFWNTFLSPSDLPEMCGSAGKACCDDEVLVVKSYDDRRAEPHELAATDRTEVGEIIIKSPYKSTYCYYNNAAETERKFHNGYIYTNDLGTWDENRYVTVVGRKDDMIISAGENIYPVQIEEVLNSHPLVRDSIVTAVPDRARGEVVTAYIVAEDDSLTAADLEEYCKAHPMMSRYKRPRYYRFVKELPQNSTGKKQHFKAKALAADDLENGRLILV